MRRAFDQIFQAVRNEPGLEATIHLADQTVTLHHFLHPAGKELCFRFNIDPSIKERFLQGLDDIGITLRHEAAIRGFEQKHDTQFHPA